MPILCRKFSESAKTEAQLKYLNRREGMDSQDESDTAEKTEQEKYDTQKEVFEQRVVALYEAGDTQYLDIVLNSTSITDFISSYYVLSEIADYDSEMLQEIGERKRNIENTKEKLEKEKKEVATIIEKQTRTSKVLQSTKALRESYISKLSDQEKETQEK